MLHGKAGTGKTTLAKLLVSNIDCDQMYVNASDENNVETVRNKIKMFASSVGFKDLKVIILDEGRKGTFSSCVIKHKKLVKTMSEAEHEARIDPEYKKIVEQYAEAEKELVKARETKKEELEKHGEKAELKLYISLRKTLWHLLARKMEEQKNG